MCKKVFCTLFAVLVLQAALFLGGNSVFATTIGEDASCTLPILSAMETPAEAAYINGQISASGSASLALGGIKGKYAVKVVANDIEGNLSYTLVASNTFTIDDYSQVHLWVKPANGAEWIEFRTATSTAKRYTVGQELVSGKWNELTLNLKDMAGIVTQGQNLTVTTDDASVWYFDDVASIETKLYDVDLSSMLNSKTEIANGGLQFKDNSTTTFDATPTVLTSAQTQIAEGKKITGININSNYANTSGDLSGLPQSSFMKFATQNATPTIFALSGNGKKLYYANPSDTNKLYCLDVMTGVNTKISEYASVSQIKVSYDGNIVAYVAYVSGSWNLYYNDILRGINTELIHQGSNTGMIYEFDKNGTIYYSNNSNAIVYKKPGEGNSGIYTNTAGVITKMVPNSEGKEVYFIMKYNSAYTLYRTENNNNSWFVSSLIPTIAGDYILKMDNLDENLLIYCNNGYAIFNIKTQSIQNINLNSYVLFQAFVNNKIIMQKALNYPSFISVNIVSAVYQDIILENLTASGSNYYTYFTPTADKVAYYSMVGTDYGITIKNLNEIKEPETYLLSFDNKLSWYTYKDDKWQRVSSEASPSAEVFAEYGMTKTEINALDQADFAKLYKDNAEIYGVNIASYFASTDCYTTPSVKSISVITQNSGQNSATETTATLYAAKQQDFAASSWRKVKKLYPVELAPKSAEYAYYIYVNNAYRVYKNGAWQTVTEAPTYLADVNNNWLNISLNAMTAEELRAIPESALTAELAGKNFSVVYALKVNDSSTAKYSAKINADYVEDLFSGTSLTLNITLYGSSTPVSYTNLTAEQVEDFMEWVNARQMNRGPIFYRINNGTVSDFINYYMIQKVSVSE